LASEAEWEYAARANGTARWSFGDDASRLRDHAWFDVNSGGKSHPVAGKQANGFGLFDMHGNVWEWVQDCYDEKAYAGQAPNDGRAHEVAGCSARVLRGGSWSDDPQNVRSAYRSGGKPGIRDDNAGVRLARMLP
jgi:formylglycine-generating enzyme required for sulfatase activity